MHDESTTKSERPLKLPALQFEKNFSNHLHWMRCTDLTVGVKSIAGKMNRFQQDAGVL